MSWTSEIRELLPLVFPWFISLSSEGRKRRMNVRSKLVLFYEQVRSISGGAWPGGAHEAWAPVLMEILKLRAGVARELDLDRGTAGRRWCKNVEKCLDLGWKLVYHDYGTSIGVFKERAEWRVKEHSRLRAEFFAAYARVT